MADNPDDAEEPRRTWNLWTVLTILLLVAPDGPGGPGSPCGPSGRRRRAWTRHQDQSPASTRPRLNPSTNRNRPARSSDRAGRFFALTRPDPLCPWTQNTPRTTQ